MLAAFHKPDGISIPLINIELSLEEYCKHWLKVKEKTASSILGLHFGHYKAMMACKCLAECHALQATIAVLMGYVPSGWSCRLTIMLKKSLVAHRLTS